MTRSPSSHAKPTKIKSQSCRFIEAAREAECSEDEAVFDRTIKHIGKAPPKPKKKPSKRA